MEYIAISLIFILGIFDGVIFIFLFSNPQFGKEVLLIHFILYLIINRLDSKFLYRYYGVPKYIALFLPGLGSILVSTLYFSLFYFLRDNMVLDDYERYINYNKYFGYKKKIDYDKEMKTLSFLDKMNLLDSTSKKEIIIDFNTNQYEDKVNLLYKGLSDKDLEIKHYSAVTLNMLENEYIHLINRLREDFNLSKDINTLKKLKKAYQSYIESGLLTGEVLYVFNREYIDLLNKVLEFKKETPETLNELIKAYIRDENFEKAEEVNSILLKHYTERSEGILNKIFIAYEKKEFEELNDILMDLDKEKLKNDPRIQTMLSYWIGNEEIL